MPFRRAPSRRVYSELGLPKTSPSRGQKRVLLCIALVLLAALLAASFYLRSLIRSMAISDARDAVTMAVNGCIHRIMRENAYGYEDFVTLEKDAQGNITAITTNTAQINALASQLMAEIAKAADSETLDLRIPVGSLLGSNLLMGRGPGIPVEVLMLTSSFVQFDNELVSTGINQSRHVITLKTDVDIDIMIPWATIPTTVETDVLIAETVIVGRVPETYVSIAEETNGRK